MTNCFLARVGLDGQIDLLDHAAQDGRVEMVFL